MLSCDVGLAWGKALQMRPAVAQLTQVPVMFSFIATKTLQKQEPASGTSHQGTCVSEHLQCKALHTASASAQADSHQDTVLKPLCFGLACKLPQPSEGAGHCIRGCLIQSSRARHHTPRASTQAPWVM